jgi:Zn-dependent M28 family amino/carboxypeptidase
LELAHILKNLKNRKVNIIMAWFDEEELGLIGSYEMAKNFKKKNMKLKSVHTIDMMGWDSNKNNLIEIERPDGDLWDYYQAVNKFHNLNIPLRRTNSGSTDHVAFRENGFKSVGLCEEWVGGDTTPHYHKKSDIYENIH